MHQNKSISNHTAKRRVERYPRPHTKQLALFLHLARILWKLSLRISWSRLEAHDVRRITEVQPILDRIAAKARAANVRTLGNLDQ